MSLKNPLVIRQSRITVLIAFVVCLLLLGVGSFTLGGPFHLITIGFLIFVTGVLLFVLWGSSFVTIFTSEGIRGKSFLTQWRYSWDQVVAWGLVYFRNGEYSIWFQTSEAEHRRNIQALGEDQAAEAKAYFQQYCGDPQPEDDSSVQA